MLPAGPDQTNPGAAAAGFIGAPPDLAPLLPAASAPPPSLENLVPLTAGTTPVAAPPPPLYLLHASLLV